MAYANAKQLLCTGATLFVVLLASSTASAAPCGAPPPCQAQSSGDLLPPGSSMAPGSVVPPGSAVPPASPVVAHKQESATRYLPSLTLGVGFPTGEGMMGHAWLGVSRDQRYGLGGYLGVGVELDIRSQSSESAEKSLDQDAGSHLEVWPVVRLGTSYRDRGDPLPAFRFYVLGGARPLPDLDYTVRLGAGASFPPLLALIEIGLPTLVEVTTDFGPAGGRATLRIGWNF